MKVFSILSDERGFRSKSPRMHNHVLRLYGIHGIYVPFCVKPAFLREAVRGLLALGIAGANVTVPYKETVVRYLDTLEGEAKVLGAVNTIVPRDDCLLGYNTDVHGFLDALQAEGFDPTGRTALVFGTGGAARAVVYALCTWGKTRVIVAGRTRERASRLTKELGGEATAWNATLARSASPSKDYRKDLPPFSGTGWEAEDTLLSSELTVDLVVNCTSVSSPEEAPPLADIVGRISLAGCQLVLDINYGREDNFWRSLAERHGVRFSDGLPMLAYQACRSFSLWTGLHPHPADFLHALREEL